MGSVGVCWRQPPRSGPCPGPCAPPGCIGAPCRMRDTSATSRCRRRCRTTACHCASDRALERGPASSGLTLAGRAGPTEMTLPPTALATGTHSPLGSEATAALRPRVMERATRDFAAHGLSGSHGADDHDGGTADDAFVVEDPRIVGERAGAEHVGADVGSFVAEAGFGDERVGGGEGHGGGPVRGRVQPVRTREGMRPRLLPQSGQRSLPVAVRTAPSSSRRVPCPPASGCRSCQLAAFLPVLRDSSLGMNVTACFVVVHLSPLPKGSAPAMNAGHCCPASSRSSTKAPAAADSVPAGGGPVLQRCPR